MPLMIYPWMDSSARLANEAWTLLFSALTAQCASVCVRDKLLIVFLSVAYGGVGGWCQLGWPDSAV